MKYSENTIKKALACSLPIIIFFSFISGCSVDNGHPPEATLSAPEGVSAELSGEAILIEWAGVENADHYMVYRRVGEDTFTLITGGLVDGNEWYDKSFPFDIDISYAVKSEKEGNVSTLSDPSRAVKVVSSVYFIQNITASVLSTGTGISLAWDLHPDAEYYSVYRYNSKYDTNPVLLAEPTGNEYDDLDALSEKPYFYRVTWHAEGLETGMNGTKQGIPQSTAMVGKSWMI